MKLRSFLNAAIAFTLAGCSSSVDGGSGDRSEVAPDFNRNALLASLADNVIIPSISSFVAEARSLDEEAQALAMSPEDAGQLAETRQAWLDATVAWQRIEVMQVGPAGGAGGPSAGGRTGGQSLREEIYSGPAQNPCRVDQETLGNGFAADAFFETSTVNAYGLEVVEILLFDESTDHRCSSFAIDESLWSALSESELRSRRAQYVARASARVFEDGERLLAAWNGGFRDAFAEAGNPGSPFRSAQDAVNEVFAAMFYVDLVVKDDKLGTPAGLSSRCLTDTCIDQAESRFADESRRFVRANLEGFSAMYTGGDGVGFDDFLTAAGAQDLANRMSERTNAAVTAAQDPEPPLISALRQGRGTPAFAEIEALHEEVRQLSELLQTQFVSVLALRIPQEGAGDND